MRQNGKLTILLYHGVTDIASSGIENYSGKHCNRAEFNNEMEFIKKNCNILSMDDVITHFSKRKVFPENSVVVTFDDGFKNNYTIALPILSRLSIPATFYVCPGIIGTDDMFWVDKLEDCINRTKKDVIEIEISGKSERFPLTDREKRIFALESIKRHCKSVSNAEKDGILESLTVEAEVEPDVNASENYRAMTWDDIVDLNRHPGINVGGHSFTHTILSALSADEMKTEITRSIEMLETHLKTKVRHYSYPEGQEKHYNTAIIEFLKECGILCSPSAIDGVNTLEDDLFQLKRIMPHFYGKPFPFKNRGDAK
ncbi:MAG: polysaccharide deacetylase family protein [Candidatus Omnitrophica bacterium]|nr:polysaccharide deacetylase family protein [Candidatus Omnitrophota bacterium]